MSISQKESMVPVDGASQIFIKEKWLGSTPSGPAVLMIHGYNALAHLCNYDIPVGDFSGMDFLARRGYDVFALDMRGFGKSSHPEPVIWEDNVSDVGAAVDFIRETRGGRHLSIVGGSYGGPIAFTYASRHPNQTERLVLMGTPFREFKPQAHEMLASLVAKADEELISYVSLPATDRPGNEAVEIDPAVVKWRFEASKNNDNRVPIEPVREMLSFRVADCVRDVHAPTSIIIGDTDFVSIEDSVSLMKNLGSALKSLTVVGNAGHGLMYETKHLYVWSLLCQGLPPIVRSSERTSQ